MTKKLVWRLSKLPDAEELKTLVEANILSQKEARELILREEEEKKIDQDELKEIKNEVELLRKLVMALSEKNIAITYPIIYKEVEVWKEKPCKPYWWSDNIMFCSNNATQYSTATGDTSKKDFDYLIS